MINSNSPLTMDVYVIQDNFLLVPEESDKDVYGTVDTGNLKNIHEYNTDCFYIPSLEDSQKKINVISFNKDEQVPGTRKIPLRHIINTLNSGVNDDISVELSHILRAFHIAQWRRTSLFCGCCGTRNIDSGTETARLCPSCGQIEFPRIAPAIITLIVNKNNDVLLAHNVKFQSGMYSLIAGFNEAGESLESTEKREIKEEISLEVMDISYIRSQPWPFPDSLMLGFFARHAAGDIKVDGIEIEDAQWFSKSNLPLIPAHGSVSRYLIDLWLKGDLKY